MPAYLKKKIADGNAGEELEPVFSAASDQPAAKSPAPSQAAQTILPADPDKPPVKRLIRKKGSGFTPSIKDALSGNTSDASHPGGDARDKINVFMGEEMNHPFTKEQFETKWIEYLTHLQDRPNLKATLSRTPEIGDDLTLKLKIENSVQQEEISRIKPDLVSWLRKELNNTRVELITEIVVQETEARPYSETEKLAEMVKKNPNISLLRQRFNLDFGDV